MKEHQKEEAYRVYVTDTLYYQADNKRLITRYYDVINHKVDNRSAEEIIKTTIAKAGLTVLEENEDDNV